MAFLQSMGINVPAIWEGIVAGIGGAIQSITAFFGNMVTTIQQYWPTLVEGFNQVMAVVMPIWESFWNGISSITDSVIKIITAVVSMGWKIITNLFNEFIGYVAPIWSSFWAGLQPIITTAWAVILDIVTNGWNFVVDLFKTVAALFTGDWDAFWQNLGALAQSAWNLLGALIGGALKTIGSLFVGAWTFIADVWGKLWTALGVLWNTFATTTNQAITETWEGIKKGFQDLSNTATATWNGFWDGLGAKTNEVVAWIKKQIENLAGAISGLMSGLGKLATALPGGAIFGAFAGPKATGGRVMGGKSYLVGEEGPELFTPPGSGKITPNNKMGGGGGGTVINFYGTVSSKEVAIEYAGEVVRQLQFSSAII